MRFPGGGLWRDPDFLKLWAGETVSDFGDQITLLALPLTAIVTLHATATEMGFLLAAATAPTFLFSLVAGVWVDRLPRRALLIAADVGRAALLATIPVAFVLGKLSMAQLYAVGFAVGTLSVVFIVAYQAYLPSLVGRARLVEANGKMNASSSVAQFAGPGVAGFLVQVFTAPMPVVLDALSFLASLTGIGLIRRHETRAQARRRDMRAEIAEGLRTLLGHPVLRTLVLCGAVLIFLLSAQVAIWVLYLTRDVGLEPALIGFLFAAFSVGTLLGALVAAEASRRLGIGPSFIWAAAIVAAGLLARALATGSREVTYVTIVIAMFAAGIGASLFNVNGPSLRQALTPTELLGRVNASYRFLVWGTQPIGALLGGALAEAVGLRSALIVTGVAMLVVPVIALVSPLRRMHEVIAVEQPQSQPEPNAAPLASS